jgi:hypothetical protein
LDAHIWQSTGKSLPIGGRNVRFAIGTPTGRSSNSWLIETRKTGDIYIICRDNFSESKVSLHASGKWRYAFTDSIAKTRPDLVSPGSDRALHKWNPPDGWKQRPIVAFELLVPQSGLYLSSSDRTNWKKSVIFIDPHQNPQLMTVVQLVVAPARMAFDYGMQEGGTIADLQVTEQLHAIVNVVFEDTTLHNKSIIPLIDSIRAYEKIREIAEKNASAVVLPSGFTDLRTMFLTPLPLKSLLN